MSTVLKPTKEDLKNAENKTVPDLIKPNLKVLFVGINPGLYTAAIGHHFGRPGNRFWPALFASGFTPRLFPPSESDKLLNLGYGISNIVKRATVGSGELSKEELQNGTKELTAQILEYQPKFAAVLGIQSYRIGFDRPKAQMGLQDEMIGNTKIWVLPNPSGLNAHATPPVLKELFTELRLAVEKE